MNLPSSQVAIQLVGPGELVLNEDKAVPAPGPHQIVLQSEAVGLCFSDMKLLAQFDGHVRKSDVVTGVDPSVLAALPSYVPGKQPTVPGHEVVGRVVATGEGVTHYHVGERWIVQADYRALKTAGSNGAFGYNFEGGLQQFVVLDERVLGNPSDETAYLIRVPDDRPASQLALVEPWACVENSYVTPERSKIKAGGRLLVTHDPGVESTDLMSSIDNLPGELWVQGDTVRLHWTEALGLDQHVLDHGEPLPDEGFDDIVYFGSNPERIEELNDKLSKGGILNIVLGGERIGRPVQVGVGRIHYGGTRWVGTTGDDPADGYAMIPETGEVRPGDHVLVVGAGGPMGQMHVIRDLCANLDGVTMVATDVAAARLEALKTKVETVQKTMDTATSLAPEATFSYFALMAPIPALVEDAIQRSRPGAIVNIFAGIPSPVKHPLDVDTLIERRAFLFGTSGSEPRDMRQVLAKVVEGSLDTNLSVAAVSGMAGAIDGLHAVENRTLDGKIVVYPSLAKLPLTPLGELSDRYPSVAALLRDGQWTAEAEAELLKVAE